MATDTNTCAQCGASLEDGTTCQGFFDQLLALEFENREAFVEHHLTVACYSLQHPAGYAATTIDAWYRLLRRSLVDGTPPSALRKVMSEKFEGETRVREGGIHAPVWWPRRWSVIVRDVVALEERPATAAAHLERVRRWAWSIVGDLDAAREAHQKKGP